MLLVKLLYPPPWTQWVASASSSLLYLTKALSAAFSEDGRLGLCSGGLSHAFKSCCLFFRMAISLSQESQFLASGLDAILIYVEILS